MIVKLEKPIQVNQTLSVLLNELAEECETVLFLLTQLRLPGLTNNQKGDILAELTGAICHLNVHTEDLPDLIGDELEALPEQGEEGA